MQEIIDIIMDTSINFINYLNNIKIIGNISLLMIILCFTIMIFIIKFVYELSGN